MSKANSSDGFATKSTGSVKKSLFERQKAEAEAKRLKEQEETAAVYEDFVKSFDNDDDDDAAFGSSPAPFPKRHFPPQAGPIRGGQGRGRGNGPGSLGPSPAFNRKRPFDQRLSDRDVPHGTLGFDEPEQRGVKSAFQDDVDEFQDSIKPRVQEKAPSKPTLQLTSLPPGTSVPTIKAFMPSNLSVDGVRFTNSSTGGRKGLTAIVTMSEGTPAGDLDTAVSTLQSKYLGWGFYLSIARHLSSGVTNALLPTGSSSTTALPFGAKPISHTPQYSLSRAPPPGQRGFAPPSSYSTGANRSGPVQVTVKAPIDIKQLKLVHKTVESVITHGPEFEALLMSRPEVQKDEKWAWIWDPRSEGGVYYRWRLWDILTNAQQRARSGTGRNDSSIQDLFENGASWSISDCKLPFEYVTKLEEVVSHSDYDSSENEDSGDEGRRRLERLQGGSGILEHNAAGDSNVPAYLNPMHKAKLIHLLSRLPVTTARLRRGDVARITSFAISHAGAGADEVVQLLTTNVHRPFNHLAAAAAAAATTSKDPDEMQTDAADEREKDKEDPSSCKLIGLYLISDILSSSSTSGVRHAWRYRALFESALRSHNTFAHLGRLEKTLSWGKLRAEKWKRSIASLLSLWEGWCVFPAKAQEDFVDVFHNPPLSAEEQAAAEREETRERAEKEKAKRKWKAVTAENSAADEARTRDNDDDDDGQEVDGDAMDEDLDGEPLVEDADEDLDGEPMAEEDEDVDGEPMDRDGEGKADATAADMSRGSDNIAFTQNTKQEEPPRQTPLNAAKTSRRQRPKAEDMFAD